MIDQDFLTLHGFVEIEVQTTDGETHRVRVREITVKEVLHGAYVDALMADYNKAIGLVCTCQGAAVEAALLDRLTRASWVHLRETEEAVNFSFAVDEVKAAHARGEALKVVKEQALAMYREMSVLLAGQTSSSTTAASAAKAPKRPGKERPAGSRGAFGGPKPTVPTATANGSSTTG